jgi:ferritin-like metal-binding protein YciE
MAWAKLLGYQEALNLLKANEQEEKAADAKLSKLAESTVNPQAMSAAGSNDDVTDKTAGRPKRSQTTRH